MQIQVPVDAGLVVILSQDFINKYRGSWDKNNKSYLPCIIPKKEGYFSATLSVKGYPETSGLLFTTKGFYVGDPCYLFDKSWLKILKDTDYFKKESSDYLMVNTDDGFHNVTFIIKKG